MLKKLIKKFKKPQIIRTFGYVTYEKENDTYEAKVYRPDRKPDKVVSIR